MDDAELASAIAAAALAAGHTIAAAESVTAGHIAGALATGTDASEWFSGSLVVYQTALKQRLLGVTVDDVISAECATQMLIGTLEATGADFAVSTTGAGGPDPEEGQPAGTVFICAGSRTSHGVERYQFSGSPTDVVAAATTAALAQLRDALTSSSYRSPRAAP